MGLVVVENIVFLIGSIAGDVGIVEVFIAAVEGRSSGADVLKLLKKCCVVWKKFSHLTKSVATKGVSVCGRWC